MFCRLWLQRYQAALKGFSRTLPSVLRCFLGSRLLEEGTVIAGQAAPRQRKEELLGKIVYVFIFDSHMSFFSNVKQNSGRVYLCGCLFNCLINFQVPHPPSPPFFLQLKFELLYDTWYSFNVKYKEAEFIQLRHVQVLIQQKASCLGQPQNQTVCELF